MRKKFKKHHKQMLRALRQKKKEEELKVLLKHSASKMFTNRSRRKKLPREKRKLRKSCGYGIVIRISIIDAY